MAWNRPVETQSAKNARNAKHEIRGGKRLGFVLGALCFALAVGAYFLFFSGEDNPTQDKVRKARGAIKEVTPAAAPKAEKPKPGAALQARYPNLNIPDDWDKPYPPQAYRADGSLKRHSRYVTVITVGVFRTNQPLSLEERAFTCKADRDICSLLTVEAGSVVVGDYTYGEQFVKDFLESLKTPIVATQDDDEDVRDIKNWVNETKIDLKARYDAGEDIAEIMNETRKQFQELGLYRQDIQKMVAEAKAKSGGELTKQDEVDLIKAANLMLEDRGCKPLALPDAFIEKVEQDAANHVEENTENE